MQGAGWPPGGSRQTHAGRRVQSGRRVAGSARGGGAPAQPRSQGTHLGRWGRAQGGHWGRGPARLTRVRSRAARRCSRCARSRKKRADRAPARAGALGPREVSSRVRSHSWEDSDVGAAVGSLASWMPSARWVAMPASARAASGWPGC